MKTTTVAAAVVVLAAVLATNHCARGFLVSSRFSSSGGVRARSRVAAAATAPPVAHPSCSARVGRRGAATALSMVSATFGEKINTDRVVLDKTAKEALQEDYPEALARNPGFLGELLCHVPYEPGHTAVLVPAETTTGARILVYQCTANKTGRAGMCRGCGLWCLLGSRGRGYVLGWFSCCVLYEGRLGVPGAQAVHVFDRATAVPAQLFCTASTCASYIRCMI